MNRTEIHIRFNEPKSEHHLLPPFIKNSIKRLNKNTIGLLLFFIASMVFLRYPSFSQLVISHDESTYLEVAREWFNGKTLYKDLIDIKPVGIFGIFGFLQLIGVKSIFGLRLVSSIFLGIGAFSLNRLVFHWSKNSLASLVSGLTFVLLHNFNFSLAINTETYFTLFVIFGFTLGIFGIDQKNKKKIFWAGILLGLAFITKYLAIMESLALFIILLLGLKNNKYKSIGLFILGCIIPFSIVNISFWLAGNWEYFHFTTYIAPFNYNRISNFNYIDIIKEIFKFFLPFLITIPFLFKVNKKILFIISLWLIFSFAAILLPKRPHEHYWIQLFAPVSVILGFSFSIFQNKAKSFTIASIIILLIFIGTNANKINSSFGKKDPVKEVIEYLDSVIKPSDSYFCANFEQVAYYLLKKDSPTPYIHKSMLYDKSHQHTFSINEKEELLKIIKHKPTYITIKNKYPVAWFQEYVSTNYDVSKIIGDVRVFKLKRNKN